MIAKILVTDPEPSSICPAFASSSSLSPASHNTVRLYDSIVVYAWRFAGTDALVSVELSTSESSTDSFEKFYRSLGTSEAWTYTHLIKPFIIYVLEIFLAIPFQMTFDTDI